MIMNVIELKTKLIEMGISELNVNRYSDEEYEILLEKYNKSLNPEKNLSGLALMLGLKDVGYDFDEIVIIMTEIDNNLHDYFDDGILNLDRLQLLLNKVRLGIKI